MQKQSCKQYDRTNYCRQPSAWANLQSRGHTNETPLQGLVSAPVDGLSLHRIYTPSIGDTRNRSWLRVVLLCRGVEKNNQLALWLWKLGKQMWFSANKVRPLEWKKPRKSWQRQYLPWGLEKYSCHCDLGLQPQSFITSELKLSCGVSLPFETARSANHSPLEGWKS